MYARTDLWEARGATPGPTRPRSAALFDPEGVPLLDGDGVAGGGKQ